MSESVRKFVAATIDSSALADKRQVLVNCSAEGVDRQGDIVVQAGIDTKSFMRAGGTVLWQHDADMPVAKAVRIGVDGGQLRSLVQFPDAGISPKADEIYGLVKAGIINATSIGFKPVKYEPMDPDNPWGERKYTEIELMEFSFVSVPAMPDATVIARSGSGDAAAWKVGASLNLPAGGDDAWDGAAAAASIFDHAGFDGDSPDTTFARKGFLAYDPAKPREKGSYRFPFAKMVDGRLTAIPGGVRSAAARLANSDLPEECRAKARAALAHYEAKMLDDGHDLAGAVAKSNLPKAAADRVLALVEAEKSGRVLSEDNMAHVKGIIKCFGKAMDCQAKALDSHGQTHADLESFSSHFAEGVEHAKSLMKAGKPKPKPKPSDDDSQVDPDTDDGNGDDPEDNEELAFEAERRKRALAMLAVAI